jgi:hypothetical protein
MVRFSYKFWCGDDVNIMGMRLRVLNLFMLFMCHYDIGYNHCMEVLLNFLH